MVRVERHIASQLIKLVKKIEIKANYWDPKSTSAFEFARQMHSKQLIKENPKLEVIFIKHDTSDPPSVTVDYSDGSQWKTDTSDIKCLELRNTLYLKASDAEDRIEEAEGNFDLLF